MKLGFMCGMANNGICTIDQIVDEVKAAETQGFDQAWMAQVFSSDAITTMSIAGRETSHIRLGTAVTPSFPRHPTALAIQVLTASAASGGRFDLGLGLSHKVVIEDMFGIPYEKPARHMREYLEVLVPLVRGEACAFNGEEYRVNASLQVPDAPPAPVLVAALGPKMLAVAGALADGTTTWMTGPRTLEQHTIPLIREAAQAAGRPAPRIVASFPIALTHDVEQARARLSKSLEMYGHLPSYRAMLDIEQLAHPTDIAILGDDAALREKILHLKAIGVTDFNAFCFAVDEGAVTRTKAFLASEKSGFS